MLFRSVRKAATELLEGGQSRSHRGLVVGLAVVMVAAIAMGVYTLSHSDHQPVVKQEATSGLRIETSPLGAAVFVEGEPTGLTTPTTLTGITRKQLAIRLELSGYAPVTRTVDIPAGITVSTQVTLAPFRGRLVISDLPAKAMVTVDADKEYEAGEVIPVVAGKHDVRVVLGGRTLAQQSIETATGDQGWKLVQGKLVRN